MEEQSGGHVCLSVDSTAQPGYWGHDHTARPGMHVLSRLLGCA